jgi:hypothetical protein
MKFSILVLLVLFAILFQLTAVLGYLLCQSVVWPRSMRMTPFLFRAMW